jgi:aspartate aminotransferase
VPELQERRDVLVEGLNAIDGFSAKTPAGSFYVPVNCSGWINRVTPDNNLLTDDTKVAEYLLHEAGVAVMFGSAFRWGEPALRWSVNLGQDDLKRACELVDVAGRRLVAR